MEKRSSLINTNDRKQDASKQQLGQLLVLPMDLPWWKQSIVMRWTAIALVRPRPKKNEGVKFWISKASLCEQGEMWGCSLAKGGQTAPRVSWARQISHMLFLQAHFNFLCLQLLTNWVTRKIVLVLIFQHFLLFSKRPHGTSICSGEDASSRSINLTSLISSAVDFPSGRWKHRASNVSTWETWGGNRHCNYT